MERKTDFIIFRLDTGLAKYPWFKNNYCQQEKLFAKSYF